jgi:site-specific DNA-methyltransferase (adenine-specific)
MYELYHGDCLEILPGMDRVPCIFADPPDGIGLKYDGFDDKIPEDDYLDLMEEWLYAFVEKADTVWLSFNTKWTVKMGVIADQVLRYFPGVECKPCVQVFSFGQHNQNDLGNNHRPLWRFSHKDAPVYPDSIRIPSARQLAGDKRADPRGRVPGDVFDFCEGDVFDFTRVVGNSKQRRKWHKTQLHEGLVERCIKSCTKEGDVVIDPFAGTGTTLRVCKQIGRSCVTMDLSEFYCQQIADEHNLKIRSA